MKVLLDTTYLLPTVGVNVKELYKGIPAEITRKGHQVAISEITVFELSAKSSKFIAKGELLPDRVTDGIRSLLYDNTIEKVPVYGLEILLIAFKLRRLLNDFIDCLILSTAINNCDVLITEDREIVAQKKNKEYLSIVLAANPKFRIQNLSEFQKHSGFKG